jgi:DNA polymerase I-like protein with 3'-5' exonuclease and polymerase domains
MMKVFCMVFEIVSGDPMQDYFYDVIESRTGYIPGQITRRIHDEIILEAPITDCETAAQILKDSMIDAGEMFLKIIPIEVEVSIVDNWSEK